jgi:hypothetical protein
MFVEVEVGETRLFLRLLVLKDDDTPGAPLDVPVGATFDQHPADAV